MVGLRSCKVRQVRILERDHQRIDRKGFEHADCGAVLCDSPLSSFGLADQPNYISHYNRYATFFNTLSPVIYRSTDPISKLYLQRIRKDSALYLKALPRNPRKLLFIAGSQGHCTYGRQSIVRVDHAIYHHAAMIGHYHGIPAGRFEQAT